MVITIATMIGVVVLIVLTFKYRNEKVSPILSMTSGKICYIYDQIHGKCVAVSTLIYS